jgi:hypothetical protein
MEEFTLEEYIKGLQAFAKDNPECLKMKVVTSKDPEGNGYHSVYYSPCKGEFDGYDFDQEGEANAVCVN